MLLPLVAAASVVTAQPTLDQFEAVLSRHDSATLALEDWCAARSIADPAQITANGAKHPNSAVTDAVRKQLNAHSDDVVALRNVRLSCGRTVLSIAWNWYLPSRLTPQMNAELNGSDTPFGKVVAPLHFHREALETVRGQAEGCPDGTISTHRARLILPNGKPLAYLIECYTAANLR